MKLRVILAAVIFAGMMGFASAAKAQGDAPNGVACTVNDYYIWVWLNTGDGIFPDCSSPEFSGTVNYNWLREYYYPNDEYGQPVEEGDWAEPRMLPY